MKTLTTSLLIGVVLAGCIIKGNNSPPGTYGTPSGGGGEYVAGGGDATCGNDTVDENGRAKPRSACADDNMPLGAPVRGAGKANDGTETCAGIGCSMTCPEGNCRFFCTKHASCDVSCEGGNCATTCTDDAQCKIDCPGGNCRTACNDGAECSSDCGGGNCSFKCDGPQCHDTCAGGNCTN